MLKIKDIKNALLISLWLMFLTFPLVVIKVNTIENIINWRWLNLLLIGTVTFLGSLLWIYLLKRKEKDEKKEKKDIFEILKINKKKFNKPKFLISGYSILFLFIILLPFFSSLYQVNIIITALMYVMLGLGLNIVVGLGGLLHLGYVAFYAVGAYSYALLNHHFGINFWILWIIKN